MNKALFEVGESVISLGRHSKGQIVEILEVKPAPERFPSDYMGVAYLTTSSNRKEDLAMDTQLRKLPDLSELSFEELIEESNTPITEEV